MFNYQSTASPVGFVLTGALTFETVTAALAAVQLFTENRSTTLNFTAITQCDSAAVAFVLAVQRAALRQEHTVFLVELPSKLVRLLQLSNLNPAQVCAGNILKKME